MTEPLLSVDGLGVEFATASGWTPVLQDVSFDVAAGQLVGLVGESGSGKSVTCSSVLRLLPPRQSRTVAGRIRFQGRDLLNMPSRELEAVRGNGIAMIFQEPMTSLNPVFTVGDQIAEVVRRHRRVNRKAATARSTPRRDPAGRAGGRSPIRIKRHRITESGAGEIRRRFCLAAGFGSASRGNCEETLTNPEGG